MAEETLGDNLLNHLTKKSYRIWDFPGDPVAEPTLSVQGAQVRCLVRELDPTWHNLSLQYMSQDTLCSD